MSILLEANAATGGPGIEPRWTRSDKEGVGTAYSALSRVWFTVSKGILNEIYYPTIDRPQIRDLQYLITDGETFFSDERRMVNTHECLLPDALGFRITNVDPGGRYRITKEIITDPHQNCLLMHTGLEAETEMLAKLRLFALLAPHLESGGRGNFGNVVRTNWGKVLAAHKGATWLVLAASVPFLRCSCGYAGATDGWQDLARDFRMDMCHSASGLLAAGSVEIPLRALIYLAWTQKEDGGFDQNFWIDGEPHWRRIQLDETAFPIILAWRLHQAQAIQSFDPYGHAWPLLTGERGHYELAAGRDAQPYVRAMERFASSTKLLPEQVWALPDLPNAHMVLGHATGGVMPLCWAHAEYIKLVRSATDGQVFDIIPEVADR